MKNLPSYNENCFAFHKKVILKKKNTIHDPTYKERVNSYNDNVEIKYNEYIENYNSNSLETIIPHGFNPLEKDTLLKLYSYKFSLIQELKIKLTTINGKVDNTCQYCTIGEVGSLDHILPKDTYPEFSVNAKNLFPCCSKCNSKKSSCVTIAGIKQHLNLYLDELPEEQYLFVEIDDIGDTIKLTYSLMNLNNIDINLFRLIRNHYINLDLLKRFNENSHNVISELIISINSYRNLNINEIKEIIQTNCEQEKLIYGFNYWKIILKLALVNDANFMSRFQGS